MVTATPDTGLVDGDPVTAVNFAVHLAVTTLTPIILESREPRLPMIGKALTQEQRAELGFAPGGSTLVYQLNDGEVILNLAENIATISVAKGDIDTAIAAFDSTLLGNHPEFRRTEDSPHPRGGKKRLRVYRAETAEGVQCSIEADYPSAGATGMDNRFVVRLSAFSRNPIS